MKYFRRTAAKFNGPDDYGPNSFKEGTIRDWKALPKHFDGNEYWEEVVVIPKPKPKTYTKKIALCLKSDGGLFSVAEDEMYQKDLSLTNFYGAPRVTDWVEVTFTEIDKTKSVL